MKQSPLIERIARCEQALAILSDPASFAGHPCHDVVMSQFDRQAFNKSKWQAAEPWVGNPSTAQLVFISSNPAFNADELFPTLEEGSFDLQHFFEERFQGEEFVRIEDNHFYVRNKNGLFHKKTVRFWNSIYKYSQAVLRKNIVVAGQDYLITEVVHCKSNREKGLTPHCIKYCRDNYLDQVLARCSQAKCFILVGSKALKWALPRFRQLTASTDEHELTARLQPAPDVQQVFPVMMKNQRALFWLPHPSSMIKNKGDITARQLKAIAAYMDSLSEKKGSSAGVSSSCR